MGYITKQGQTWDEISVEVYGTEMNAGRLMEANPELVDIFIFPYGLEVITPVINRQETDLPPWRR